MSYIDEIDAIMNSSPELSKPKSHVEEIDEIMASSPALNVPSEEFTKTKDFNWARFLGEKFTEGAINLADLPQTFVEGVRDFFDPRVPVRDGSEEDLRYQKEHPYKPVVSSAIEAGADKAGIDLHSQGEGNTAGQRVAGHAAQFAGSSIIPGGGASGLAKNVAVGAGIGAGSGLLQENTNIPPIAADLTAVAAALLAHMGAPKLAGLLKNSPSLTEAEKRVAGYVQNTLGEEATGAVAENIANRPQYPTTGYEPTTAEVANNPLTSLLHRLRQGVPGSGLAEAAGAQNDAITKAATKLSLNKSSSAQVKDTLAKEVATRKTTRHAETEPLYTALRKDKTQVDPVTLKSFLEEEGSLVKGKMKGDLEGISKLIKPSSSSESLGIKEPKVSTSSGSQFKLPDHYLSDIKPASPQGNAPTVAELDQVRQNLVDRREELLKSGQKNRARQFKEAIKALDKDLEVSPIQREATAKYAELSKPVNDILEHETIKKIPDSRLNDIFPRLFNKESHDNIMQLKKVLKDNPTEWKGIQDATLDHMMKSIRNAKAEGKGNALSYDKFNKFLKDHGEALKEIFNPEQMQLLGELGSGLTGRNIAESLGLEKTSATYGKLVAGTHLGEGLSSKLLKGASYAAHPIPRFGRVIGEGIRTRIERYAASKEADVMAVLDKFLREPDYAHKLFTHKFESQADFNKWMNSIVKKSVPIAANKKEKKTDSEE